MSGEWKKRLTATPAVKRPYWMLFKKEVMQALPMFGLFVLGIVAWQVFLFTRFGTWPPDMVVVLAVLPAGAIPFWLLWRSYSSLRQEWTGNHMYLLLSLPTPGWYITSVKAIVVTLEVVAYGLVTMGGFTVLSVASGLLPDNFWQLVRPTGSVVLLTILWLIGSPLAWAIVVQFSYIAGRLASRAGGFISVLTFCLSGWFIARVSALLEPLLRWLPEVAIRGQSSHDGGLVQTMVSIHPAPAVGVAISVLILFFLGSSFLERDVEL